MAKIVRNAFLVFAYLVALSVLPGAYTGTGADETAANDVSVQPSATPEVVPSPDPTPTESEATQPTPAPEAFESPEPMPDPTPAAPEPDPSPSPDEVEEAAPAQLSFSLSAAPNKVAPGQNTTISATLSNASSEAAEGVDVTILLPNGLEYLSATPSPDSVSNRPGGVAVTFMSLGVPGGGSISPSVHAAPEPDAKKTLAISGQAAWTGGEASDQTVVQVETPETKLQLSTSGGGFLKEVGGQVSYEISVTNTGQDPAEDVTLVNLVPAEVHVTGAGLAPGVDAVQVGNSGGREDVVWVINELPADETIQVTYTGTIESAGDLEAVNKTQVSSTNAGKDSSEERTYLATSGGSGSDNPSFDPIQEKRVTRHRVVDRPLIRMRVPTEADTPETGSGGGGAELPFTGIDPMATVTIGMALVALGMIVMHASSVNIDRKRLAAGSVILLLVAGACMSNGGDAEVEPEVKGIQITRGPDSEPAEEDDPGDEQDEIDPDADPGETDGDEDPNDDGEGVGEGEGDGPGTDGGDDETTAAGPEPNDTDGSDTTTVLVPGDPEVTFEREVDFVTITADDLSVEQLGSATGSSMAFGWNDSSGSITHATSSSATLQGVADLTAQISPDGPGMKLTVSVTNLARETVLGLDGTLAIELDAGGTRTLRTGSVDVELNPGGSSSSSFSFRLPTGSYSARAVFLAS